MSNCKYTEVVTPNTCLGDSLATFNSNFTNLDNGLCLQPLFFPGNGVRINRDYTEQNVNAIRVSTTPAALYSSFFEDYLLGARIGTLTLPDTTKIQTTVFPLPPTSADNPAAVFSAVSLTNTPPRVTIFWTASGIDYTTIYATNSATNVQTDMGTSGFNGSINTMLSTTEAIYVAGSFTSAGGYEFNKFCAIDINKGTESNYIDVLGNFIEGDLGKVGQVVEKPYLNRRTLTYVTHPLTDNGGFGREGAINALLQFGNLLIIGGSYKNVSGKNLGRGLTIWNSVTNRAYPFYVNGEVNALVVQDDVLYVGSNFNFINYGPTSATDISGQRVYTNGLAKISLSLIDSFANKSIIKSFSDNILAALEKHATIHTMVAHEGGALYVGGYFRSYGEGTLIVSSLALITPEGTIHNAWYPIIDGVVNKLLIDKQTLYAGGSIPYYLTSENLDDTPRPYEPFYNLVCFDVTLPFSPNLVTSWKPKVNGPVVDMAVHNGTDGSEFIYCYGNFDEINGVSVNFLGAVPKNAGEVNNIYQGQTPVNWKIQLDKPPQQNTKALLRLDESVLIGGVFSQVNGAKRKYLAHINGPYESLQLEQSKYVIWNLGAQLICPGGPIAFETGTNITSLTTESVDFGKINKSIFSTEYTKKIFEGYNEGSLMRFYLQRQYSTDSLILSSDAYVVGWKIDFGN